jgi:hypothetical protein
MRVLAIIGLVIGLLSSPALAQDAGPTFIDPEDLLGAPHVTAAATPSEVELARRFVLVVTSTHEVGVTVNLPSRIDLGPAFEEQRRTSTDKQTPDGKLVREWQIEVIAWELGDLEVPPVQVTFIRGGKASAVMTNSVPVRVVGALGDLVESTQPRDHAPPLALWKRTWIWAVVAATLLLLLIAAAIFWRVSRRRGRPRPSARYMAAVPLRRVRLGGPAEEALARLEAIDTSGMLARDRKVAYTEMVDVMRVFLGRQFDASLDDATTGELRAWLAGAGLSASTRLELSRWLDECDLVKFGGFTASIDEGRAHLGTARDLVVAIAAPSAPSAPKEEARA